MTTQTFDLTVTTRPTVTLDSLENDYREAFAAAEAAWRVQSVTTVDEGYTYEQANAAIEQAKAADAVKRSTYTRWQMAIQARAMLDFIPATDPDIDPYEYMTPDGCFAL